MRIFLLAILTTLLFACAAPVKEDVEEHDDDDVVAEEVEMVEPIITVHEAPLPEPEEEVLLPEEQAVFYFDFDKSDLSEGALADLDMHAVEINARLGENADLMVEVVGHTDERGTQEYNMALGLRRAEAVKSYLLIKDVPEASLSITSYGEEKPAVEGNDEAAWAQNRRAVLTY